MLKINDVPGILEKVPGHISIKVIADIEKRTLDWIDSGGSESIRTSSRKYSMLSK